VDSEIVGIQTLATTHSEVLDSMTEFFLAFYTSFLTKHLVRDFFYLLYSLSQANNMRI